MEFKDQGVAAFHPESTIRAVAWQNSRLRETLFRFVGLYDRSQFTDTWVSYPVRLDVLRRVGQCSNRTMRFLSVGKPKPRAAVSTGVKFLLTYASEVFRMQIVAVQLSEIVYRVLDWLAASPLLLGQSNHNPNPFLLQDIIRGSPG